MTRTISLIVNGHPVEHEVSPRLLLSDFLRADLGLTGTHVGCEHGVCGCCTILFDGEPVRSCLMFAVQTDGHAITTVEGLAPGRGALHPIQEAFRQEHALQCGFCTPGFLMTLVPFLERNPDPSDEEIREALSGNLCRCTGYQNIVRAVRRAVSDQRSAVSDQRSAFGDQPPATTGPAERTNAQSDATDGARRSTTARELATGKEKS